MNPKKKLTSEKIKKIIDNTKATLFFEDMIPSHQTEDTTRKYLSGLLTEEEALQRIREEIENSNRLEKSFPSSNTQILYHNNFF